MPLTLEPTIGGAASNAYADVAGADALVAYRVGASAWAALTPDQKIQALVTATRDLDTVSYRGSRATSTQALEWPRTGTAFGSDEIPPSLVAATIELALAFAATLSADVLNPAEPAAQGIKREKVGLIETEFFDQSIQGGIAGTATYDPRNLSRFPSIVQRLLTPLVLASAASGWGSATVRRGS